MSSAKQYSPKPRRLRRSLITVSSIVGLPHRLHSIAMSRLRLSFSDADIKRGFEHIKNNMLLPGITVNTNAAGHCPIKALQLQHWDG
jgi:hypothetical protein